MKKQVNELLLNLILEEAVEMTRRSRTDKDREWLIKAYKETHVEEEAFEDGELDAFSVDSLERMLLQELKDEDADDQSHADTQ